MSLENVTIMIHDIYHQEYKVTMTDDIIYTLNSIIE